MAYVAPCQITYFDPPTLRLPGIVVLMPRITAACSPLRSKPFAKYGTGHGQQGGGGPGDAPAGARTDVARAEVLLVDPARAPKRPADKEPTYRLRKKMGLI